MGVTRRMGDTRRRYEAYGRFKHPLFGTNPHILGVKPSVVAISNIYTDSHTRTRRIAAPTATTTMPHGPQRARQDNSNSDRSLVPALRAMEEGVAVSRGRTDPD